ncbi:hypothetical protein [Lentzea sp. NBRC 105346]|uniref:hypothetical protein n=1 Tax=Lentzea sp. NBRC 105346 TaxID=3032205 RepID=UPI0025554156|nr:hypothetical protein [Lentzea sp. NBRC 105346]
MTQGVLRTGGPLRALAVAAVVSGIPSTVHAIATRRDPLAATRAAGSLLGGGVAAGVVAHLGISAWWTLVLTKAHVRGAARGAAAGAAIALLDLEIIGRRYPEIRALPRVPQWLDHIVFGAVVGALL